MNNNRSHKWLRKQLIDFIDWAVKEEPCVEDVENSAEIADMYLKSINDKKRK